MVSLTIDNYEKHMWNGDGDGDDHVGDRFDGLYIAEVTKLDTSGTQMPFWWHPRSLSNYYEIPVKRLTEKSVGEIWAFSVIYNDDTYIMCPTFYLNPKNNKWEYKLDNDQTIRAEGTQLWIYHDCELDGKINLRKVTSLVK